jgi:hypothetical protein
MHAWIQRRFDLSLGKEWDGMAVAYNYTKRKRNKIIAQFELP